MEAIKNAVQSASARKDSIVVTDPTGSVFKATAAQAFDAGYDIRVMHA